MKKEVDTEVDAVDVSKEVIQLNPDFVKKEAVKEEIQYLKITEEDVNFYLQVLSIMLVDDSRLSPLQKHFIEIIKRNNEVTQK